MRGAAAVGLLLTVVVAAPAGTSATHDEPVHPSGRLCFGVAGLPGDVALVNLTPVQASGLGHGQLVSSDVVVPPEASNVNFGPGTVDPNVAAAPIGVDGEVCYLNSVHSDVDVIADHLGTIDGDAFTFATKTGAPDRKIDTRDGGGPVHAFWAVVFWGGWFSG